MKSIEVSARTIEEAISEGLLKLDCSISDCKVDILQEGAKGLFGFFGSKPATIRLTLISSGEEEKDPDLHIPSSLAREAEKPSPKPEKKKEPQAQQKGPVIEKVVPAAEKKPAAEKSRMRIAATPQVVDKPKNQNVLERFKSAPLPGSASKPAREAAPPQPKAPRAVKQRVPRAERPPREERADARASEPADRTPVPAPEHIVLHDPETLEGRTQQFLLEMTRRMGVDVQVDARRGEDGHVFATIYGDTLGILIGRRGETLDALQYLTSLKINRGQEEYTRVTLDTENYRAKREEALTRLAARMANRAVKTGRKVSLEPMNPYERRILHASLQNNPNVSTHSEGDEPYRHVVVVPEK